MQLKRKRILGMSAALAVTILSFVIVGGNHQFGGSRVAAQAQIPQRAGGEGRIDQPQRQDRFDRIADAIIVGVISEEQFLEMNLTEEQQLEVFKRIRDKRGWGMNDEDLSSTLRQRADDNMSVRDSGIAAASGDPNQFIEMESGNQYSAYPLYRRSAIGTECGTDRWWDPDVVQFYNTPKWPNTNADMVRNWSTLWWVRWVLSRCYTGGRVAGAGMNTNTTKICIGVCGRTLGSDLNYLYLWHK